MTGGEQLQLRLVGSPYCKPRVENPKPGFGAGAARFPRAGSRCTAKAGIFHDMPMRAASVSARGECEGCPGSRVDPCYAAVTEAKPPIPFAILVGIEAPQVDDIAHAASLGEHRRLLKTLSTGGGRHGDALGGGCRCRVGACQRQAGGTGGAHRREAGVAPLTPLALQAGAAAPAAANPAGQ